MDKTYQPQAIESHWYAVWEKNHYFAPRGEGKPYCIMLPPPNVTGSLHMGHGFGFTLMDVLVRYHRMLGDNTLWLPGTDHAGIATQMVVEKQLMIEGKNRHDLGREQFEKKIWEWKNHSGTTITKQLRRMGFSLDWDKERFTMDESLCFAVREVFIRLYEEKLIYRGTRLVNWDPKLLTAISDLEVISTEEEGKMFYIRYPLVDGSGHLTVATTRPETMLGDVAVAVNPEDERYQHMIGKELQLPLTERKIPIIADEYVDKEFGTGCVKITPAHDFNDYAVGQRHKLTPINIFTKDAHINENAPIKYQGLDRFVARKEIIQDLEYVGLVEKIEKHTLKIPRGERSDVVIEPFLTEQWFMKMEPLAAPAIKVVEEGQLKFIPQNWEKTYFQWLNNIEDWCISRQLWWGHRIPAWYDEKNNIYVGQDEADVRKKYNLNANVHLHQEEDVLDTWFSSALWPFSTLGWPDKTPDFKTFYPTKVLATGFDIIFFWVARMIMMGLKFTGEVPFKEVFITGLIRDAQGHKMSKSKGNVLDPLDLIDGIELDQLIEKRTYGLMQPKMAEKIAKTTREDYPEGIASHGTDALRFTFCAFASHNREIRFDLSRLEGYRNFCNKLWNATRYVLMNTENWDSANSSPREPSLPDKWILSRLQTTIQESHDALAAYRFDLYAQSLYEFIWNELCDWYLELSKPILTSANSTAAELNGTKFTLLYVLETTLRLLHPIMPFITEEIWQKIAPLAGIAGESIMIAPFPQLEPALKINEVEEELNWVKQIIISIRTIRSEMNVSPAKPIDVVFRKANQIEMNRLVLNEHLIKTLARISGMRVHADNVPVPESAIGIVGELEILIPMAGLIDKAEEETRLSREIAKLHKEKERAESKLHNPNFVDKAPEDVVRKEQARLAELDKMLQKLEEQRTRIVSL